MAAEVLSITVVSDVVCPWCFIGKRRLEVALTLRPDIAVAVRWHPYFLNPWIARAGISRHDYLTTKFGSVERYAAIAQRVAAAASAEGLTYAMDRIARQPNTLDCHRLIHWAQQHTGDGSAIKQRLMDLYFTEGGDLTDPEVLVAAAAACSLDAATTREWLLSERDIAEVTRQAQSAKEAGIDGVPCFIFGDTVAVSGAQAADYLADTMQRAVADRDRGNKLTSP